MMGEHEAKPQPTGLRRVAAWLAAVLGFQVGAAGLGLAFLLLVEVSVITNFWVGWLHDGARIVDTLAWVVGVPAGLVAGVGGGVDLLYRAVR